MPKRKPSRRRAARSSQLLAALLLVLAALLGWLLLRPLRHTVRPARPMATATPTQPPVATAAPTATPAASPTASPTPAASAAPSASAAVAPTALPGGPKLALIIDDCGQWVQTERGFIALPIPITLAILPDVHATSLIMHEAAAAGKGIMLHLPMETISGLNPGPGKVTTEMTDAQITHQVEADLAQVPLAQGVNNHEGSKATADPRVMRDVARVLASHGHLFFIDSRTIATTVAAKEAAAAGIPSASRNVFLDNKETVAYTEGQLREAAAIAKRTGSAIAIGHPRPSTLAAVRAMIPKLQAEGITFVFVKSLTR